MSHEKIYLTFKQLYPSIEAGIVEWFPNGKDSIRVRNIVGSDFIFTYHGPTDWCYETLDSFIRKLKGGRKMNVRLHENIYEI